MLDLPRLGSRSSFKGDKERDFSIRRPDESKTHYATRTRLHQVRAANHARHRGSTEVVHLVLHPGHTIQPQHLCPLRSLRLDFQVHSGVEGPGFNDGDGRESLGFAGILPHPESQFLDCHLVVRIDAHFARNLHCFDGNFTGGKVRVLGKGLRRSLRIRSTTSYCSNRSIGLNYIALAAEQEALLLVADEQKSLEMPQEFVGSPVARQFDGSTAEIPVVLLQLRFKPAEQGKRIRG